MTTITAQKRDMSVKAKQLRREGFVPGIVCGREVKEKMTIQMTEKEAMKLIRENDEGERVELKVGDETIHAIIKDYSYNAVKKQLEVLDFQALVKGEKIHTSVEVVLKNETMAAGNVNQELSKIAYKADPEHLIDTIVIDFEKMKDVKLMKVSDLEEFKDPNVTTSNPDAVIFSVTEVFAEPEEEETEGVAPAAF